MQALTVVSLFDGISVGQLVLHMAGIPIDKYIAFEINKDSIKVTQYHYPATIQCGDVRNFYWESIGHCDLLIGGSPCQDLSSANRNRCGLEGSKSSLFWEYVKAKNVLKPKYFLLENVQMPARDFEIISQALPDGYTKVLSRNKAAACIADSWTAEVIAHIFKFLKQELEKGEKTNGKTI